MSSPSVAGLHRRALEVREAIVLQSDRFLAAGWKPVSAAGSDRYVVGPPN